MLTDTGPYRPKILIVEDEPIVAMDLDRSLVELGYEVTGVAESERQAIRLVEQCHPDLVLMDIQLKGGTDGIAAADEIRDRWQIPVVFVTANVNVETLARAKAAGPYGYLTKPFRINELNATIVIALHQHRISRELFAERGWLKVLLESITDGVIATDADGVVRFINSAAQSLTGSNTSEALGRHIKEVYRLTTLSGEPVEECQLLKAIASAAPVPKERFLLRTRGGAEIPVEDAAAPILERGRVIGAVTVFLDISDRLHLEKEQQSARETLEQQVHVTSAELGATQAELRALSVHLMAAQEEERRRIARELHDDLGQRTAVLGFEIDRVLQMADGSGEIRDALGKIQDRLADLCDGLREVSHQLHPSILTDIGLPAALRALVTELRERGRKVKLTLQDDVTELPQESATALYRITQEAFRNIAKHAPEGTIRVALARRKDEIELRIEDAGPGFDLNEVRAKGGLGLLSMQERARSVGGRLLLHSRAGDRTLVLVRVPPLRVPG